MRVRAGATAANGDKCCLPICDAFVLVSKGESSSFFASSRWQKKTTRHKTELGERCEVFRRSKVAAAAAYIVRTLKNLGTKRLEWCQETEAFLVRRQESRVAEVRLRVWSGNGAVWSAYNTTCVRFLLPGGGLDLSFLWEKIQVQGTAGMEVQVRSRRSTNSPGRPRLCAWTSNDPRLASPPSSY